MAKQSREDRHERLKNGACPVHGIDMPHLAIVGARFSVACPRRDCAIQGITSGPGLPVDLAPEFAYLLD